MQPANLKPIIRCAIYTRKSTEEGLDSSYNSLEAQYDSAGAYIRSQVGEGWILVPDRYDDPAYSGGNMERPALTRLLQDIRAGKINMVVVYKIDRLSRSLMDFAKLASMFEQYGVSFSSVTEQFSTASAIGRLHLNIILSFAQFERELAGERIRDKVAASKRKGMWMGGVPPLGYNIVDRKLVVNAKEAEMIQEIFQRFILLRSLTTLTRQLRAEGYRSKSYKARNGRVHEGKLVTPTVLHHILRNPIYVGKIRHKENLYQGQHEALISEELWEDVQAIFAEPMRRRARKLDERTDTRSILNGKVTCSGCNCAMTHTFTRRKGKLYRYYTPSAKRRQTCHNCPVGSISAGELENLVLQHIRELVKQPEMVFEVWKQIRKQGQEVDENEIRQRLRSLDDLWAELFPAEQNRLVDLLLNKVELSPGGAHLHFHREGVEDLIGHMTQQPEAAHEAHA